MRLTRPLLLLLAVSLAPAPARCEPPDVLVVGIGEARPYEVAIAGFRAALGDGITVRRTSVDPAKSELEGGRVEAVGARVLLTLGSQATAWTLAHTHRTPVVFAMVLDPVRSGLISSFSDPGPRVTGAALDVPPEVQFRALRDLLGARRVGVLYNPEETGELLRDAGRAASREGVDLVALRVPEPAALDGVLESIEGIDAIWAIPDRTIYSSAAVQRVLLQTLRRGIPFMGLSEQYVRAGALLAISVSYEENGRNAARQVRRVLAGQPPAHLRVRRPEEVHVVFNPNTARRLGIDLSATSAASSLSLRPVK